jgi:CxxC motif-containing protein (DUF1111 family)
MRTLKLSILFLFAAALVLPFAFTSTVEGQGATEAPRGFDNLTNGFVPQGASDGSTPGSFEEAKAEFSGVEEIADGLGPCYNAQSCRECHQNPVTGGISQITELRAGHFNGFNFVDHPGGSLINDRATNAEIQERVLGGNEVRTFRTSLNVLGDGFVEAIGNTTLTNNVAAQPSAKRGTLINVTMFEAGGTRVGRFGWKDQQASLLSFSADAYLNEMGITSSFLPAENTSNGTFVGFGSGFDPVPDPEDNGNVDVALFATFMRATKAPPRGIGAEDGSHGPVNPDIAAGSALFNAIGCADCHTRTFTTVAPGTPINGGALTVGAAIGNKIIHPFSDFALHNIGTGDGIVQNGGQGTRNQLRTPVLWGMRTRDRLMHDGETLNRNESILRHAGQAAGDVANYNNLSTNQKNQLILFLNSL